MGLEIAVTRDVLVPRPETEHLAEAAVGPESQVDSVAHAFDGVAGKKLRVLVGELAEELLAVQGQVHGLARASAERQGGHAAAPVERVVTLWRWAAIEGQPAVGRGWPG